ncbi:GtrA family protein [Janibacter sp. GXQ6167]|uniref:GtrA family protein n=1 Tax=Janibacter sp. GXQ6167 TaxID=3240791 RepID=UPI0035265E45
MPENSHAALESEATAPRHGGLRGLVDTVWHEIAKFGVIGAIAFVIDLGGMNLLTHTLLEGRVTTAKIVSGIAATLFAWAGNRWWTFRHRRSRPMAHEVFYFFVVNGIALVVATFVLVLSHYVIGGEYPWFQTRTADNIATIIGIGLGTILRFWLYRAFVFADEGGAKDEPA